MAFPWEAKARLVTCDQAGDQQKVKLISVGELAALDSERWMESRDVENRTPRLWLPRGLEVRQACGAQCKSGIGSTLMALEVPGSLISLKY